MILDYLYNLCYRSIFNKNIRHVRAKFLLMFIISSFFTFIANFIIPALFPKGSVGIIAMCVWFLIVLPPTIYTYRRYSNRDKYLDIFKKYNHYSHNKNKMLKIIGMVLFLLAFVAVPIGLVMGFRIFY